MWRRYLPVLMAGVMTVMMAVGHGSVFAQGMRPPPPVATTPPLDLKDPDVIAAGSSLFRRTCTGYCHGSEGRLSRAPALRGREFEPRYLFLRISSGSPPMPAFQTVLSPEDIWKLVAYIMSLQDAKD